MSANTASALSASWSGENVDEIDAAEITLRVMDPSQNTETDAIHAWVILLDEGPGEAAAQLAEVAEAAGCSAAELRLVGIEFAHPEQYDTTVTLSGTDLEDVIWCFEGIEISGAPAAEIVLHQPGALDRLEAVRVPVIG